ncbi:MAG TPA: trehalose-6-phosphate synthase [Ignavibacteriales bacterium]|nr:trehalose-6-phosphate synthase [Ignavibacteriales bacterium]
MKVILRLVLFLFLAALIVASAFSYLQVQGERSRLEGELDSRASVLAESLQESVKSLLKTKSTKKLKSLAGRLANRERLMGISVYDSLSRRLASSSRFLAGLEDSLTQVDRVVSSGEAASAFLQVKKEKILLRTVPVFAEEKIAGAITVVYDAAFIDQRIEGIWKSNFGRLLLQTMLVILAAAFLIHWSVTGPVAQIVLWMKNLRTTGKGPRKIDIPRGDLLKPISDEIILMAKSLAAARSLQEEDAKMQVQPQTHWSPERLREFMHHELEGKRLLVVSNREPFMHKKEGSQIECIVPAGGLVTALEPVLRACGGVWIALGSGDADRETSDSRGKLAVPPDEPAYELRRVFISKEEEEGYYYGFSNEGMWPLCHITHTRPIFRLEDWMSYQNVNEKFAQTVLDEIKDDTEPLILIQDYHFALLPFLIKSKRPDARIAIFWHIPWPNPEVFGICPWKQEILVGLLGADLIGFHIQFHCNNFLESIDRFLESKINWEHFTVERQGKLTSVKPFPISIAFPEASDSSDSELLRVSGINSFRESVLKKIGLNAAFIGAGVDRIDYTKGILERFRAVERFFEKYPSFIGRFTFVELGAPSRTHIKRYHDLMAELDEAVEKINWRFQSENWKPIVFLKAHHSHQEINLFYKACNLCMVTSLHDGMNLVAKEFIASREDEDGVLILSQFTGASRELQDSLIINPYSIEEMADAILKALTMDQDERVKRMRRMREVVRERNVYRWAANMVTDLSRMRIKNKTESELIKHF